MWVRDSRCVAGLCVLFVACGEEGIQIGGQNQSVDAGGDAASQLDAGPALGPFNSPRMLSELADPSDPTSMNDDPSFTEDRLELYFESNRAGGAGSTDLYVSTRSSTTDPWGPPRELTELNTPVRDNGPGVSGDGLTLWFSSARPGGQGGSDIWVSTRPSRASAWRSPDPVVEINSSENDQLPSVTDDGLTILFSSTRAGGVRGFDIYVARRADPGAPWQSVESVPEVNTEFDDTRPLLRAGGRELYFSGIGLDPSFNSDLLWASRSETTGRFGDRTPLEGVNTTFNEEDGWISSDRRYLLFASDRSGRSRTVRSVSIGRQPAP